MPVRDDAGVVEALTTYQLIPSVILVDITGNIGHLERECGIMWAVSRKKGWERKEEFQILELTDYPSESSALLKVFLLQAKIYWEGQMIMLSGILILV